MKLIEFRSRNIMSNIMLNKEILNESISANLKKYKKAYLDLTFYKVG